MNNVLIIFPSWEERSILGFRRDVEKYQNLNKVFLFIFEHSTHPNDIYKCISDMAQICTNKGIEFKEVIIPNSEIEKWHMLDNFVKELDINTNVYIDITTMPRSIIWTLLFFFRHKFQKAIAIYHKPKKYCDTWLSKDPGIPQLLFKHSGIIEFEKPTSLFVLVGYDADRIIQLINFYEPHNIIVGNSNQRNDFKFDVANIEFIDINQHDSEWGYKEIESKISDTLANANLIVASLGPKTGAISVYQCFMKHPEIALTYVPCKQFNIDYSKGISDTLEKEISFC